MSGTDALLLIVRTPHEDVYQRHVRSIRVPTETGHVGLRPRTEPTVLAVEAGVVNIRSAEGDVAADTFIGTAGGLLICKTSLVTLLTPIALVGHDEDAVVKQIDELVQQPNSELEARATLSKLEGHILNELRREQNEDAAQRLEHAF